ncbi:MAG: HAD family hydrolase [Nanoarchaeota archaeon]|nr:HAD family hydrolase [Nanoarchaeota archaeon]
MIKAIIFDFDGVLMDSRETLHKFILIHHPEISESEIEEIFHVNAHSHPIIKKFVKEHREEIDAFFLNDTTKDSFYNGAKELIEELENNFQLFINTSAPTYNVKHFLSLIEKENSFKEILGFDIEVSKVKKFQMILDKYNLKKDECLFVTDTLGDLREAEEVEIKSIGVTWGVHKRETLKQGEIIAIVDNYEELLEIIQKTKS